MENVSSRNYEIKVVIFKLNLKDLSAFNILTFSNYVLIKDAILWIISAPNRVLLKKMCSKESIRLTNPKSPNTISHGQRYKFYPRNMSILSVTVCS